MNRAISFTSYRSSLEDCKIFIKMEVPQNPILAIALLIFPLLGLIACAYTLRKYALKKYVKIGKIDNKGNEGNWNKDTCYRLGLAALGVASVAAATYCLSQYSAFSSSINATVTGNSNEGEIFNGGKAFLNKIDQDIASSMMCSFNFRARTVNETLNHRLILQDAGLPFPEIIFIEPAEVYPLVQGLTAQPSDSLSNMMCGLDDATAINKSSVIKTLSSAVQRASSIGKQLLDDHSNEIIPKEIDRPFYFRLRIEESTDQLSDIIYGITLGTLASLVGIFLNERYNHI